MSSSNNPTSKPPNRYKSESDWYPDGWVDSLTTRHILKKISNERDRSAFKWKVDSLTNKGFSAADIGQTYAISGYDLHMPVYYNTRIPANGYNSKYLEVPVEGPMLETPSTRHIRDAIEDSSRMESFKAKLAWLTNEKKLDRYQINDIYTIRGYDPRQYYQEKRMESMADSPTRSQRSGEPRQARSSRENGGNGGRRRDNDSPYAEQRGEYSDYVESPRREDGGYHTSGAGSNIDASRPGLQVPGSEPARLPRSMPVRTAPWPPSTRGYHGPSGRSMGSHNNRCCGICRGPSYVIPLNDSASYQARPTPSGNRHGGHPRSIPYVNDEGYSSGTDLSDGTLVNHHFGSPQGRASGGNEQGRRGHGGPRL